MYDGEKPGPQWHLVIGVEMLDVKHKSLPAAMCLALVAVLDAGAGGE